MDKAQKEVTWFLQIEGKAKNQHGASVPRMIDWEAKLSHPVSLRDIGREMRKKALAEKLSDWSLVHLHCLGG